MRTLLSLCLLFVWLISWSQNEELTLEDIYKKGTFRAERFQSVRWMKDNKGYSALERNTSVGARDLVRYDAKTGERTVLISAERLIPVGATEPLSIYDYQWSADDSKMLIFTNTKRVWRYHTKGDYWVLDIKSGDLTQIGQGKTASELQFAKFSPQADRVAYVYELNLYVDDLATGKTTQLTSDGGDNIINGTFDWVYEEELSCRDGFRWSPDGSTIAYWQSDTEGTGTFYMINNIDSIYSQPIPLPYPKVGTTNSAVKVGVVSAKGGPTRWFDVPGDPRNNYLARMDFIPNSNEVMIQQLNRLQNTNTVWVGDVSSMKLTNILTDKDDAFLDIHDNIKWLKNEKYFTWTSEKDGWLHLYRVSRDGNEMRLITKGEFDVVRVNCIDTEDGYVYYIASPDDPTQRYLYRSRLDGKGQPERMSPESQAGQHSYYISDNADWAVHTFQNAQTPPFISLVDLSTHKTQRVLVDNKELKAKYEDMQFNPKEFYTIDIGEVELYSWMIKPKDFDPKKKYPVIFYVYGEPAGSTVQDSWSGGALWEQYLAQQGYIVISVDNRGTRMPRGRNWRKSIYGQIGIIASQDQEAAAKKIIEMYSFVDPERIGVWGWSGGGSMTLNCLFRSPDIYSTGISVAPVSDQRLYDTIYQERYMGLPQDNSEGYFNGSPINFSQNLRGNLLLVHGTADDNVHYQSMEMLTNKLVKEGKMFDMMSYPMRSHGIYERDNTSLHLRQTMTKYWLEHLEPGGKEYKVNTSR